MGGDSSSNQLIVVARWASGTGWQDPVPSDWLPKLDFYVVGSGKKTGPISLPINNNYASFGPNAWRGQYFMPPAMTYDPEGVILMENLMVSDEHVNHDFFALGHNFWLKTNLPGRFFDWSTLAWDNFTGNIKRQNGRGVIPPVASVLLTNLSPPSGQSRPKILTTAMGFYGLWTPIGLEIDSRGYQVCTRTRLMSDPPSYAEPLKLFVSGSDDTEMVRPPVCENTQAILLRATDFIHCVRCGSTKDRYKMESTNMSVMLSSTFDDWYSDKDERAGFIYGNAIVIDSIQELDWVSSVFATDKDARNSHPWTRNVFSLPTTTLLTVTPIVIYQPADKADAKSESASYLYMFYLNKTGDTTAAFSWVRIRLASKGELTKQSGSFTSATTATNITNLDFLAQPYVVRADLDGKGTKLHALVTLSDGSGQYFSQTIPTGTQDLGTEWVSVDTFPSVAKDHLHHYIPVVVDGDYYSQD